MKPKRILIARHAESVGNVNKGAYATTPDYALPLTPRGVSQAAELGTQIRRLIAGEKIRFYVSPWRRTRETFMGAVSALDSNQWTATEDPRLREQEWGHLRNEEATKILEQERDAYGTFYYRFDDGESGADVSRPLLRPAGNRPSRLPRGHLPSQLRLHRPRPHQPSARHPLAPLDPGTVRANRQPREL